MLTYPLKNIFFTFFFLIIKLLMSLPHEKGYMPWDRSSNKLLIKSQLGKNKPTNYDIPHSEFVYGRLTYQDPQHANQVMYQWKEHNVSPNANHLKEKDFRETNKFAVKSLLHTSSQFSEHRKTNTLFKPVKEGTNLIPIKLPEQNHTYGKPLELEDPVKLVIANTYGEDDKLMRNTFYQNQSNKQISHDGKLYCHITKNHNLLKEATVRKLERFDINKKIDQWKLPKFSQVGFKVETRRPRVFSTK